MEKITSLLNILIITILLFSSCSTKKIKEEVTQEKLAQISKDMQLPDKEDASEEIPIDLSRIAGSAHTGSFGDRPTYYLEGAEDLKLDNYYFDIPVVYNKAVRQWMKFFLNRGRRHFRRYTERAGRYAPIAGAILEDMGLPRDLIFLAMAESGFQNKAKSWAKAVGPWQFMPYTGKAYGLKIDWYLDERRDPLKATMAAGNYLKKIYRDFNSWELAFAGYNAGEGKIRRAIKKYKTKNFWKIRKGRYLKKETREYVPKIMALAIIGKNLKAFGFDEINFQKPLAFEEIELKPLTDLYQVASKLDLDFKEVQKLNPEISRWFTPPNMDSYFLRVPVGYNSKWLDCCSHLSLIASDFQRYQVKRTSSIKSIAKSFKIKKSNVLEVLNNTSSKKMYKKGQYVLLPFKNGQSKKAKMYADLYDKPRKSVARKRKYKKRIRLALKRGRKITNPSEYYKVKKGESLWSVSKKTGTNLDTLIASNLSLIKKRRIRAGDRLIVR